MIWLFGDRLNRLTKVVVHPCSADEAAKRHENGGTYAAVLRDEAANRTIVGVELALDKPFAGVHFYDDLERPNLTYLFQAAKERPGLFLGETRFAEYETSEDREMIRSEVTLFHEVNRKVYLRTTDKPLNFLETKERAMLNSEMWLLHESVPDFGDYGSLLRLDRDRPVEDQPAHSPNWAASATPIA